MIVEWSLYPVSLIKKLKLKAISLGHEWFVQGQYRPAVKMRYGGKEKNVDYVAKTIHHELYHYMDWMIDGKIYGGDPEWEKLNVKEFSYKDGGKNYRVAQDFAEGEIPGFFNFYSTTAVEEDKAEVFKYVIVENKKILEHKDEIVRAKAMFIKEELTKFDKEGVTAEWWESLQKFAEERTYVNGAIGY